MNKYTRVLVVFNCQGAAWSNVDKKNVFHDKNPTTLSGTIRAQDVHLLVEKEDDWDGELEIFTHSSINRYSQYPD